MGGRGKSKGYSRGSQRKILKIWQSLCARVHGDVMTLAVWVCIFAQIQ